MRTGADSSKRRRAVVLTRVLDSLLSAQDVGQSRILNPSASFYYRSPHRDHFADLLARRKRLRSLPRLLSTCSPTFSSSTSTASQQLRARIKTFAHLLPIAWLLGHASSSNSTPPSWRPSKLREAINEHARPGCARARPHRIRPSQCSAALSRATATCNASDRRFA